MELSFVKHVKEGYKIGDIGCGPNGAIWWDQITNCEINAFDLNFEPPSFMRGGNTITFSKTDVFKKELTVDKGYFYGYEFLFKKTEDIDIVDIKHKDFATKVRESLHDRYVPNQNKIMELSDWATGLNNSLRNIRSNFWFRILRKLGLIK